MIHHVLLACPPGTESASREFYSGVLGLTEIEKPSALARRGGCWFRGHGIELHLGVETDFRPARKAHPGLLVTGIDEWAARLTAAGYPVTFELAEGARQGHYQVVLIWALDRLSQRSYRDLSAYIDRLAACDCEIWSQQEPCLSTVGPFGEIIVHLLAWMAEQETKRLGERVRSGMARAKAEGKVVGGRKPGARDKRAGARANRSAAVSAARRGQASGPGRAQPIQERRLIEPHAIVPYVVVAPQTECANHYRSSHVHALADSHRCRCCSRWRAGGRVVPDQPR